MKKQFFLYLKISLAMLLLAQGLNAQINIGGQPLSFSTDLQEAVPVVQMSALNMADIAAEDEIDEQNGRPPRFGFPIDAEITMKNSGVWETLVDGSRVWRLGISCPGASSINFLYDAFWLPEGSNLYIYNEAKTHTIGGFTSRNNNSPRGESIGYATGLVYGDKVILEYYEPADVELKAELSIAKVVHGYRHIDINRAFEDSGDCQVNINCSEGDDWQFEKRGVALILVDGTRWCTGSLVNNTLEDFTPYFLTAHHCLDGFAIPTDLDAVANPNGSTWSFWWDYESPDCENPMTEPTNISTVGAILVSNNDDSDFALFRLTEDPLIDLGLGLTYNGWDATGANGDGGVGIHHPSGDIKKIATHSMVPTSSDNDGFDGADTHWRILWDATPNGFSITEPGSSGSPLFDDSHRIIGQLHGGGSGNPNCSDPANDDAFYGKFFVSWDGGQPERRLRDWLDPSCNVDLTVSTDITIGAPTFYASNNLDSDNDISGAITYVVYNGGNEVLLTDGFEVRDGANFIARNFDCSNTGGDSRMDGIYTDGVNTISLTPPDEDQEMELLAIQTEDNLGLENLSVFPNPTSNEATFKYEIVDPTNVSLSIVNLNGVLVKTLEQDIYREAGVYETQWSVGDLPHGIYLGVLKTDFKTETIRLTVGGL